MIMNGDICILCCGTIHSHSLHDTQTYSSIYLSVHFLYPYCPAKNSFSRLYQPQIGFIFGFIIGCGFTFDFIFIFGFIFGFIFSFTFGSIFAYAEQVAPVYRSSILLLLHVPCFFILISNRFIIKVSYSW